MRLHSSGRPWTRVRQCAACASALLLAIGGWLPGAAPVVPVAAAATIAYPDLQVMVPTAEISIGNPTPTTRELRFSHITWNGGAGPLEIRPAFDSSTGISQGTQRLYTYDSTGKLTPVQDVPIVDPMVWVPPDDYRFPLSAFGLYALAADGSVGAQVAPSPKVDFCMTEDFFVGGLPNTPSTAVYSPANCANPSGTLGLSVGWGDKYDYTDTGENIDITSLADGTYWLRATADPFHYLQESNTANNITDTQLTIHGTSVTILAQTHPDSTPPVVSVTSPTAGASVLGTVSLASNASAASGVTQLQFLLDGQALGAPLTTSPYSMNWDSSTTALGAHLLSAQATDTRGFVGTAVAVPITVSKQIGTIIEDQVVRADGSGNLQTPSFSTTASGELLVVLAAADAGGQQSLTISGAGLAWSLVKRANAQLGTSEIWVATASAPLTNATITSAEAFAGYSQSLTVLALRGTSGVGASTTAGAATGAPTVSLTTQGSGSWIVGVGNDWDLANARTIGPNQQMLHQFLDSSVGNTYWAQALASAASSAGSVVTLNDTAPTTDRWNYAAVEVVASGGAPPPDTTPPTVSIVNPVSGQSLSGSVTVSATASDNTAVSSLQFLLDGQPLGAPLTTTPYSTTWDTTKSTNASHTLGAQATDPSGNVGRAAPVTVSVSNPVPVSSCFIVDVSTAVDGHGQVTTPSFHTALPGELVLAFATSDGPSNSTQSLTISGAGLTWKLVKRANTQNGTAEIWTATAATTLTNATVTSKPTKSGYDQSLTVIAMQGTAGTGASVSLGARSGAPSVSLTTTKAGSLVFGVGNDWDNAIPRTLGPNQILDHQWVDTATGDTYWVQNSTAQAGLAGSTVTLNDTAPTADRWNFAAVEILGAGG